MIRRSTGKSKRRAKVKITDEFRDLKKKLYGEAADILSSGFKEMVDDTPVDTGFAASNWRVSTEGTFDPQAPAKSGGPYRDKEAVIMEGFSIINLIKRYGFSSDIKFVNTTPYINELEYGHSSQNSFFIKRSALKMKTKFTTLKV